MPTLIQDDTVNITVNQCDTQVTVGIPGIQGPAGGGGGGSTIINNYSINSGSGIFIYRSGIASGISKQFINFPTLLDSRPIVIATLHNDFNDLILPCQVSGANPTGFWVNFSEITNNTGYYLDIFASNSQQTGMATNVIVNNTIILNNGITGISITGSNSITGLLNITGDNTINFNVGNQVLNLSLNEQRIRTNIPTGSGNMYISFNPNFSSIPILFNNLETSGDIGYCTSISGVTVSGYTIWFSDIIRTSGVTLYTLAKVF